ncbi:MAG: hypothetical protein APU95_01865 [Hadesarchaea archaeon YNP_N21]|nr:MAG: hypothetical protein APU95_01865 [Hadesarchaea archaeon YNP_N21]
MPDESKIFNFLAMSALIFLFIFFIALIASIFIYVTPSELVSSFFSEEIVFSIKLSMATATIATLACEIVSIPAAYALSRFNFPGKKAIDVVLYLPIGMPPVALGAALLMFFGTPVGKTVELLTTRFVFEVPGIILAQFTIIGGLATKILKSTFDGIDPEYEFVARTLGCNSFQAFYKIALPLSKNGVITALTITWVRALGEFGATIMLAGATRMKTETLPVAIFLSLQTADVVKMSAVILIMVGACLLALLIIQKLGRGWPEI